MKCANCGGALTVDQMFKRKYNDNRLGEHRPGPYCGNKCSGEARVRTALAARRTP